LNEVAGVPFYNTSSLTFKKLLDDPNHLAQNLAGYINAFSPNVRNIFERFDYMLANPPFGVEWKQQETFIRNEAEKLGHAGRFGAGLPRINDGALLFLQHMISKMRPVDQGGTRLGIVFNGSPLFTGDAGSGESNIRQWIIENDWLEAIVALPDQLFYNTGISTYIWILTNRKEKRRRGKVLLFDARNFWDRMPKSLGNKRHLLGDDNEPKQHPHIQEIARIYGQFKDSATWTATCDGEPWTGVVSKVFDNADFGYRRITVERPLRLNFSADEARVARLADVKGFANLAVSKKKEGKAKQEEVAQGEQRQQAILAMLRDLGRDTKGRVFKDRDEFRKVLDAADRKAKLKLTAPEEKAILEALGEKDETAEICRDSKGNPEPDPDLRDTENVPLKEDIATYFKREVLPHVPDAWIDESKTKVGYEIPLNRLFYQYVPPRPLTEIDAEIKALEKEIFEMLEAE